MVSTHRAMRLGSSRTTLRQSSSSQIAELLQHFVRSLEIDGQRRIRIFELLGGQQNMAVNLVLRIHEMDVAGGTHRLIERLAQCQNGAVELPQFLLTLYNPSRSMYILLQIGWISR